MSRTLPVDPPITRIEKVNDQYFIDLKLTGQDALERMQDLLATSFSSSAEWDTHRDLTMAEDEHTFILRLESASEFLASVHAHFNRAGEVKQLFDERQTEFIF